MIFKAKKRVYLDYSAATPSDPAVVRKMNNVLLRDFGNPSSLHYEGTVSATILRQAREDVAGVINARPEEIVFTGGGTESINLSILGAAFCWLKKNNGIAGHIITSKVEHHATLRSCQHLESLGFSVTYLSPDEDGFISAKDVSLAIKDDTFLISLIFANNEIGTVLPVCDIARAIRGKRGNLVCYPYFHVDACQATNYVNLDVVKSGVDLMTISGSKIYATKGVGCLFVKNGVRLSPILHGGGHERGLRAGTENIPAITGFAEAMKIVSVCRDVETLRLKKLQKYFFEGLKKIEPNLKINGSLDSRLPNNINVSFPGVLGEQLVVELDEAGVSVSAGSACSSNDASASHVVVAIGVPYELALGTARFSMGRQTTKKEIDYVFSVLPEILKRIKR